MSHIVDKKHRQTTANLQIRAQSCTKSFAHSQVEPHNIRLLLRSEIVQNGYINVTPDLSPAEIDIYEITDDVPVVLYLWTHKRCIHFQLIHIM